MTTENLVLIEIMDGKTHYTKCLKFNTITAEVCENNLLGGYIVFVYSENKTLADKDFNAAEEANFFVTEELKKHN